MSPERVYGSYYLNGNCSSIGYMTPILGFARFGDAFVPPDRISQCHAGSVFSVRMGCVDCDVGKYLGDEMSPSRVYGVHIPEYRGYSSYSA